MYTFKKGTRITPRKGKGEERKERERERY